jgi:hypothetical protein
VTHDLFISYSSEDKQVADAVCSALEVENIRCWIAPRDISPGQEWADAIVNAVADSRVMVLIFSSNSNDSKHVKKELALAINANVIIIPMRIEDIPLEGTMEYYLSDTHWLDAMNPPTEQQIRELTDIALRLLPDRKAGREGIGTLDGELTREEPPTPAPVESVEETYGEKDGDQRISILGKDVSPITLVILALVSLMIAASIIVPSVTNRSTRLGDTRTDAAPTITQISAQMQAQTAMPAPTDSPAVRETSTSGPTPTLGPDYLSQFVHPLLSELSSYGPIVEGGVESSWDDIAFSESSSDAEDGSIRVEVDHGLQDVFAFKSYNMALQMDLRFKEMTRDTIMGFEIVRRTNSGQVRIYQISLNPSTGDWHSSIQGEDPIEEGVIGPLKEGDSHSFQLIALEDRVALVIDDELLTYHQADDLPSSVHLSEGRSPGFNLSSPSGKTTIAIENIRYWNLDMTQLVGEGGDWVNSLLQPIVDYRNGTNPHYSDDFTGGREDWASGLVAMRSYDDGYLPIYSTQDDRFDMMNMVGRWTEYIIEFDLNFELYRQDSQLWFGPFGNPSLQVEIWPGVDQLKVAIYEPSTDESDLLGTWGIEPLREGETYHWTMVAKDNQLMLFIDQTLVLREVGLPEVTGFFRVGTENDIRVKMEHLRMWNLTRME